MIKRVLVINLGWEQRPLIERLAGRNDCELFGIHYDNNPEHPEVFQDIFITNLRDLERLFSYSEQVRPDAVISDQCDYSLLAQAAVACRFGLPGPSLHGAQLSNNKYLQREASKAAGILVPKYSLCSTPYEANTFAREYGLPIILKPTDNRGSFGVGKVETPAELSNAFFTAMANSHSRCVLAEEFIDGEQITVDGYAFPAAGCQSVALGTKLMSEGSVQVALGISYPGRLPGDLYDRAMKLNASVNQRLGFKSGMTHSEYMIREGEIYLIETANRGGGVYTSELIAPTTSGIDLLAQYIGDCLGEPENHYRQPDRQPVVLRFFSFAPGRVSKIRNWERVAQDSRVISSHLKIKIGDDIRPITTDANRHGFIIVRASPEDAETLLSEVKIDYV